MKPLSLLYLAPLLLAAANAQEPQPQPEPGAEGFLQAPTVVPSPLTSMTSTAAGAAGMPFVTFFLSSLVGFLIFVCLLVVLGTGLLALFGISAD